VSTAEHDVVINFLVDKNQLIASVTSSKDALDKLEPSLKQIKSNLKTFNKRTKRAAKSTKGWADKLYDAGRSMGFTGFVLEFTFRRIMSKFTGFIKSALGFTRSVIGTDKAIKDLGNTIQGLALGGHDVDVKNITEDYKALYDASALFEGQLARLDEMITPFKTALANAATAGLGKFNDKIQDLLDRNPQLVETFETLATTVAEDLGDALGDFVVWAGENEDVIQTISDLIIGFVNGIGDGLEDVKSFVDYITTMTGLDVEKFGEGLGRVAVQAMLIGTALGTLGSVTQFIGLLGKAGGKLTGLPGKLAGLGGWLESLGGGGAALEAATDAALQQTTLGGIDAAVDAAGANMLQAAPYVVPGAAGGTGIMASLSTVAVALATYAPPILIAAALATELATATPEEQQAQFERFMSGQLLTQQITINPTINVSDVKMSPEEIDELLDQVLNQAIEWAPWMAAYGIVNPLGG